MESFQFNYELVINADEKVILINRELKDYNVFMCFVIIIKVFLFFSYSLIKYFNRKYTTYKEIARVFTHFIEHI